MNDPQRNIPAELRRQLLIESGHRCSIPQCAHSSNLDIHHIKPWSEVREHSFENLIVLCPNCHRLVHDGKIDRKSLFEYKKRLSTNQYIVNHDASSIELDRNNFRRLNSTVPADIFYRFKIGSFGDHRTMEFLQPLYHLIDLCNDPTFVFRVKSIEDEKSLLLQEAIAVTNYINQYLQRDPNGLIRIGPTEGQLNSDIESMSNWSSIIDQCTFKMWDILQKYENFVKNATLQLGQY